MKLTHGAVLEVIVGVRQSRLGCERQKAPHAPAAVIAVPVFACTINGGPIKRQRGIPQALLLRYGEHVGAAEEAERVGQVDEPYDEHVGHDSHVCVRYTLRNPDGTRAGGVGHDVKNKRFVAIVYLPQY